MQGHGVRGESDFGDGVWGSTFAPDKTGVFGWNQSRQNSPPDVPGGNGVFGLSSVPNASGVYGLHDHGGVGVAGYSLTGIGIQGGGKTAAEFNGHVNINGDVDINGNAHITESLETKNATINESLEIKGELNWKGPTIDPKTREALKHWPNKKGVPGLLDDPTLDLSWAARVDASLRLLWEHIVWLEFPSPYQP